jgi:DNA replication and repair protein RecF
MLSSFSLTSWRGIDSLTLTPGERTYIQWANGSGKTHILDAIHMLSGSRPLYGDVTLESGSEFEGIFDDSWLRKSYRMVRDETREYYAIQWAKITKPKYMTALPWRTVHISPFDMNLLYFAPAMRRDYIDLILARTYAQFPAIKRNYDLMMRQRNAILKSIREGLSKREDLDYWDSKFAEVAESYGLYRARYVAYVRDMMPQFPTFFAKYAPEFHYESSVIENYEWEEYKTEADIILQYLKDHRERDILIGHTHIGPHRDDWGFRLQRWAEPIPVESYLSRGEMKMLLLWLKIIERQFIASTLDIPVILLIDDIFAELDDMNADIFLSSLMQYQVILTSQKPLPNQEKYQDFACINLGND